MKILGTITDLVTLAIRKVGSSFSSTISENAVAPGADRTIQLPPGTPVALVGDTSTQTLTGKTLTSPVINSPTGIVKADVGLGSVDDTSDSTKNAAAVTLTNKTITSPLGIVKGDVGLGNVDNTSDATKNAATATLTNKTITSPLGIVKADVGLGNVDNTSDATKNSASATLLNKTTISSTGLATGALSLPTGNATTERPTGTAAQLKGMIRYNDTDDVFEGYNELTAWSSIGGGGSTDRVTQASHAFVVGDVLYLNGAVYAKARADVANTAEVVGMVSRVIDANNFEITLSGEVSGLAGLTAGTVYFLSPGTAGATTATEPSVVGQVSLPVGVASTTTTMYVQPKRGVLVGATNVRTQIALANNATTTVQNVSSYEAGELSGSVIINATASLRFFVNAQFSRNGAGTNYNVSYQASGDVPPVGFQVTITSAGLLQVVMPSVTGFASAAITYGLDVAAVGATLPLSINPSIITVVDTATEYAANTRLGLMQYVHGTTYNGGIAPTISVTNLSSVSFSAFIPYQMSDGTWRLRFNFGGVVSVAASTFTVTINGVTFKSGAEQAIVATSSTSAAYMLETHTNSNAATMYTSFNTTVTSPRISGDVILNSKPTWAY